jgi:hypothetical protein
LSPNQWKVLEIHGLGCWFVSLQAICIDLYSDSDNSVDADPVGSADSDFADFDPVEEDEFADIADSDPVGEDEFADIADTNYVGEELSADMVDTADSDPVGGAAEDTVDTADSDPVVEDKFAGSDSVGEAAEDTVDTADSDPVGDADKIAGPDDTDPIDDDESAEPDDSDPVHDCSVESDQSVDIALVEYLLHQIDIGSCLHQIFRQNLHPHCLTQQYLSSILLV